MQKIKSLVKQIIVNSLKNTNLKLVVGNTFTLNPWQDLTKLVPTYPFKTILDVGANRGNVAIEMTKFFHDATIYAFEPIKETYSTLVKKTENFPNIKCFNCALGDQESSIKVYHQKSSALNSLVGTINKEYKGNNASFEIINVMTIEQLVEQQGLQKIDLLKTDTEGFDINVLQGAASLLKDNQIPFILTEVGFSESDMRHTNFIKIFNFLQPYGFFFLSLYEQHRFGEMGNQGYANALFVNPHAVPQEQRNKIDFSVPSLL